MIDAEKYYQKLISGIRIGTNGYIVVKNADGTIIMHPDKKTVGNKGHRRKNGDVPGSGLCKPETDGGGTK